MRKRLFWNTLIISAIVLTVFGSIGAIATDLWYSHLMVAELKTDSWVIAGELPDKSGMPDYAVQESVELSAGGNDVRVTLISPDGTVLGDSSADWRTMENHSSRPEVASAIQNGWGSSQRYSDTLKVRMLYVAVYDSNRMIVVRTAMPMVEINKIYWVLAGFILASILVSLGLAALLARRTSRLLSQPVVELMKMAQEIASGNYHVEAPSAREPEFTQLSNGLLELAKDLDEHVTAIESNNLQLTTVLASINEGLIAMDGGARLLFINQAACQLLGLDGRKSFIGQKTSSVIPVKQLCELAAECLEGRKALSAEIILPGGNLLVRASASPMREPASGCILLLLDLTQLRKLENMRRDFVSNVTHELRTPLTLIRGYVEALQGGALADPELSSKFMQIIEIESERLSTLISDLLYLSEIESNTTDTGVRLFHLEDVVSGVLEVLGLSASERNVTMECNIGADIQIEANPDRIKQLLLNLVDNAVKYNHDGGSVKVSAEKTHGLARISVKDTGIGISEEHASRIFERFYRVDKGRSRSMGGTGLGLSIVKHIVDLYHGNIRLISEEGKGSEFIIELPLRYETKKI